VWKEEGGGGGPWTHRECRLPAICGGVQVDGLAAEGGHGGGAQVLDHQVVDAHGDVEESPQQQAGDGTQPPPAPHHLLPDCVTPWDLIQT